MPLLYGRLCVWVFFLIALEHFFFFFHDSRQHWTIFVMWFIGFGHLSFFYHPNRFPYGINYELFLFVCKIAIHQIACQSKFALLLLFFCPFFRFPTANRTNQNSKKQIKSLKAMEKKKNEIDYHLIKLCHSGGQIEFWLSHNHGLFPQTESRFACNSSKYCDSFSFYFLIWLRLPLLLLLLFDFLACCGTL